MGTTRKTSLDDFTQTGKRTRSWRKESLSAPSRT